MGARRGRDQRYVDNVVQITTREEEEEEEEGEDERDKESQRSPLVVQKVIRIAKGEEEVEQHNRKLPLDNLVKRKTFIKEEIDEKERDKENRRCPLGNAVQNKNIVNGRIEGQEKREERGERRRHTTYIAVQARNIGREAEGRKGEIEEKIKIDDRAWSYPINNERRRSKKQERGGCEQRGIKKDCSELIVLERTGRTEEEGGGREKEVKDAYRRHSLHIVVKKGGHRRIAGEVEKERRSREVEAGKRRDNASRRRKGEETISRRRLINILVRRRSRSSEKIEIEEEKQGTRIPEENESNNSKDREARGDNQKNQIKKISNRSSARKPQLTTTATSTFSVRAWAWAWVAAAWMICATEAGVGGGAGVCPRECDCKWKDGKETVACIGAEFEDVPRGLPPSTQVLDLKHNNLQELRKDTFYSSGLVNLQKLWLNSCNLHHLHRGAFNMLANLVELDLSKNLLRAVPTPALCDVPGLRDLRLAHNALAALPENAFSATPELVRLDLSYNRIDTLDEWTFRGLASLQVLKLTGNALTYVSQQVLAPLLALHGLHLNGNPWSCDCSLRPLRRWMIEHKVTGLVPPTCARPRRVESRSWRMMSLEDFSCAPEIIAVTPRVMADHGDNVSLECRVDGDVEAGIAWTRGQRRVKGSTGRFRVTDSVYNSTAKFSNLTIEAATTKDEGVYWCVAETRAGRSAANVTLEVSEEISEFPLVAINPAYMTGGLLSGLGVLVLLLLLVSCIAHRRQRVQRFRRQAEDLEGREVLAQASMSRGSSILEDSGRRGTGWDGPGDMEDAPLHPHQKPVYRYGHDDIVEKLQRYTEAVLDPTRGLDQTFDPDLDLLAQISPTTTLSRVELTGPDTDLIRGSTDLTQVSTDLSRTRSSELTSSDLPRTRSSDLTERRMSLKNLEHETDILRRECSPSGSVVSMVSNGPYLDPSLDLPYATKLDYILNTGFHHSLNSHLGALNRKPNLSHYLERRGGFPSWSRNWLTARCHSDLDLGPSGTTASAHTSTHEFTHHPRLRRAHTRHPSLPNTPRDSQDLIHARDAARLRRRITGNRGIYHSLEGADELAGVSSNPYRYQFRTARLDKYLHEHRTSLQEQLYPRPRTGSSSRIPTYKGSLDTSRFEPSSTCSSPFLEVELGGPGRGLVPPEPLVGLGGLGELGVRGGPAGGGTAGHHIDLRPPRTLSTADQLLDGLTSRTIATPDSLIEALRPISPQESVLGARVPGGGVGGSSESMKGRVDSKEVLRDAMHRRGLQERGDAVVDVLHRRSMDRGEVVCDAMQRSLEHGCSFEHGESVVDAIHRRSLDRTDGEPLHRGIGRSDSMTDVMDVPRPTATEPLRSILKNRYEGGGLLYPRSDAYNDAATTPQDTAYASPEYHDFMDS